jgi:hypothetical protein
MRLIALKQVVASILLLTFSTQVLGRTCEIIAQECLDGPSSKSIQGISVYRDCWKYQNSMSCWDEDAYDYCQPLTRTPGCKRTSQVINDDGSLTFQFQCGKIDIDDPQVILLEESYTINQEEEMPPECAIPENNPSCRRAELICVDSNGNQVAKVNDPVADCATWVQNYACNIQSPQNFCAPLVSAGCTVVESNCVKTSALDDSCVSMDVTYRCLGSEANTGPMPDNIVRLEDTYTLSTKPLVNECADGENDPVCYVAREECLEGAETRIVDGVEVYNDCWRKERKYACLAGTPTSSDCKELEEAPGCKETGSECTDDEYVDGRCKDLTREFKCLSGEESQFTYMNCGNQMICHTPSVTTVKKDSAGNTVYEYVNGQRKPVYVTTPGEASAEVCFSTSYPPDTDFGKVIASLEAAKAFGYQIFKGEPKKCVVKKAWGLNNCCNPNHAFRDGSTRRAATKAGLSIVVAAGSVILSAAASSLATYINSFFTPPPVGPTVDPVSGVTSSPVIDTSSGITTAPLPSTSSAFQQSSLGKYLTETWDNLSAVQNVFTAAGRESITVAGTIDSFQAYIQTAGQLKGVYEAVAGNDSGTAGAKLLETMNNLALGIAAAYIGTAIGTQAAVMAGLLEATAATAPCIICLIVMIIIVIVALLITAIMECDEESAETGANLKYGLCSAVGSYCTQKTLKLCYKKMRSYCCFASMLARIVQEQGRPQLGMSFGRSKDPDCRSFTEDEFMRIDFDRIDFTELINSMMRNMENETDPKNPVKAGNRAKGIGETVYDYYRN